MRYNIEVMKHKNRIVLTTSREIELHQAKKILEKDKVEYSESVYSDGLSFIFKISPVEPSRVSQHVVKNSTTTSNKTSRRKTRSRRKPASKPSQENTEIGE